MNLACIEYEALLKAFYNYLSLLVLSQFSYGDNNKYMVWW